MLFNNKLRITALLTAAIILLVPLASCSGRVDSVKSFEQLNSEKAAKADSNVMFRTVMTVDGFNVTYGMYRYYLSQMKYNLRQLDSMRTDEQFWRLPYAETGLTMKQYAINQARDAAIQYVIIQRQYAELGLVPTDDFQSSRANLIDNYKLMYVTDEELSAALDADGMFIEEISDIQLIAFMFAQIMDALFADGGAEYISDDAVKKEYDDNYVRVKHIQLNTFTYDTETGAVTLFDDAQKAAVFQRAEDIFNRVKNGEDFDAVYLSENDDPSSSAYIDGFVIKRDDEKLEGTPLFDDNFMEAAFEMDVDDVVLIETMYGYDIVKKYDINVPSIIFENKKEDIRTLMTERRQDALIEEWTLTADVTEFPAFKEVNFEAIPSQMY